MTDIIIYDYKEVNLKKAALAFFLPDGRVISINKIKGLKDHIDYLKILVKNCNDIANIVSDVDLDYYYESKDLAKMYDDVWPLYSKAGISLYMNIAPNDFAPTDMGIIFLPEDLTKEARKTLQNMDKQILEVIFTGIGHYLQDIGVYDEIENEEFIHICSKHLFNIVDDKEEYTKNK